MEDGYQIPEEASVTATTFYTTALSQRQVLYDVKYSSKAHLLETSGYTEYDRVEDVLVIFRRGCKT